MFNPKSVWRFGRYRFVYSRVSFGRSGKHEVLRQYYALIKQEYYLGGT